MDVQKHPLQVKFDALKKPYNKEECGKFIDEFPEEYKRHFFARLNSVNNQQEINWIMKNIQTAIDTKTLG